MSWYYASSYAFLPLASDLLPSLRASLFEAGERHGVRGTVLLAEEGVNFFVAGESDNLNAWLAILMTTVEGLQELASLRYAPITACPFKRWKVNIKKEIITMGARFPSNELDHVPNVDPDTLKDWLDRDEVVMVDTRNTYEWSLGKFDHAVTLPLEQFRDFEACMAEKLPELQGKKVVIYCTGGIRCEKAGVAMRAMGLHDVHQLQGGILHYFERCGGAHYHGECFVFDERGTVAPDVLQKTSS